MEKRANLNEMVNDCCRLCSNLENVINVFSEELTNSEKLRKYILTCSGVNILTSDIITKCICYNCCETVVNILKFRKDAITNDLSLKSIFRQQNDIDKNSVNDLDIEDVFNFLPSLQKELKGNNEDLNILNFDTKMHTVNLGLAQNNMNDLKSMPTKVPEDLDSFETTAMGKGAEFKWDEFNDLIVKEETVVMSNGLEEDIEVGKEVDEPLKREIVSDDEVESPKTLDKEMSIEKEERNEQGGNEINLDKYKHIITKEIIIILKDCLSEKSEIRANTSNNFVNGGIRRKNHLKKLCTNRLNTHHNVHSGKRECECSECGKHFSTPSNLNTHRLIHSDEKPHKCSDCGQCFRHIGSLTNHRLIHSGEKPHKCSECGQCFRHMHHLNSHRLIHSGEKPYKCSDCGQCFRRTDHLTQHRRIHSGEKPYKCTECGKCFRQTTSLIRHRRIHSSEKPYKCSDCGKCFRNLNHLNRHRLVHTSVEIYECSECGESFRNKFRLNQHQLIHSGVKPHKCSDCGKCFRRVAILNRHRLTHSS